MANSPSGQSAHAVLPVALANVPITHGRHALRPVPCA